ncbi:MAG: AAA family ATPase, partial [Emcibacter sp.]|nr:AAA family ATPase [Emcibacter sp.]
MKVDMDDLAHSMTDAIELAALKPVLESLSKVVYGQSRNIKLALCCFLSRGHLLLDGVPGVGKTTMAKSLATVLGLDFKRIQCTSDLLPSDVLGYSLYNATSGEMTFQPGPIFSQTLLIDELNRASPKTQSAFLEAMAERQVTLDNMSHPLPEPFFVIATQNPAQQLGTFPLPEAQLDRFLMSVHIDYPSKAAEQLLYREGHKTTVLDKAIDFATVKYLQNKV